MKNNNKNSVFYKNTIMLYLMTGVKFLLPVVITACLTRRLGEDNYGVITYMTAVMNYFLMMLDFGFNYSATKTISKYRDDKNIVQHTINNVITAKLWLGILGLIILALITPFIDILREHIILTLLYYISTFVNVFIPDFLYRGLEKMEYVTIRYIIAKIITAVLIFACVKSEAQMLLIPVFYTIGTLVAAVYTISHMRKAFGYRVCLGKLKDVWLEIKESFVYFISTFASIALGAFTTLIMGIVNLPTAEIAYWGVAFQVVQAVQALYDPITSSIYPRVSATRDYKFVLKAIKYLTIVVIIGCIASYFLAGLIIKILAGDGYEPAVTVLRLLIPLFLFSFWAQMLGFPLLGALDKQKQVTISTIISAVFHISVTFVIIGIGKFNLTNISILRDFSELVLFAIRLVFVINLLKSIKIKNER